jgi:hypothetical protein
VGQKGNGSDQVIREKRQRETVVRAKKPKIKEEESGQALPRSSGNCPIGKLVHEPGLSYQDLP